MSQPRDSPPLFSSLWGQLALQTPRAVCPELLLQRARGPTAARPPNHRRNLCCEKVSPPALSYCSANVQSDATSPPILPFRPACLPTPERDSHQNAEPPLHTLRE